MVVPEVARWLKAHTMIDIGPFQFAAAPRTATTWILHAISTAGLGNFSKSYVHVSHLPTRRGETEKLKVSMVRHPYDWLASYYAAIKLGHVGVPSVDRFQTLSCGTFKVFIESYLREMPGAVGDVFTSYGADVYLKLEELPWCFIELLETIGISKQRSIRCKDITRQNWCESLPKIDTKLRRYVLRAEQMMVQQFEYV